MAIQPDAISRMGFQPRKGYVHPDARGRLTLGSLEPGAWRLLDQSDLDRLFGSAQSGDAPGV